MLNRLVRNALRIGLLLCALVLFSDTAHGEDCKVCKQITSHGIFDLSQTSTKESLATDYLKWMESQTFDSEQHFKEANVQSGGKMPIQGVPVEGMFDAGRSSGSKKLSGKKMAEFVGATTTREAKFTSLFITANTELIAAWSKCISLCFDVLGFRCWAIQTGRPDEIKLKFRWKLSNELIRLGFENLSVQIQYKSDNVETETNVWSQSSPKGSIIFKRVGPDKNGAANFLLAATVRTINGLTFEEPGDTQIHKLPNGDDDDDRLEPNPYHLRKADVTDSNCGFRFGKAYGQSPAKIGTLSFDHVIEMHAPPQPGPILTGFVEFKIPAGAKFFRAVFGLAESINPEGRLYGRVRGSVRIDGTTVWTEEVDCYVANQQWPQSPCTDVGQVVMQINEDAETLRLEVRTTLVVGGQLTHNRCSSAWGEPRFTE